MPSKWTRATCRCRCGGCGTLLEVGAPIYALELPKLRFRKIRFRCTDCAGPAPPDLPTEIEIYEEALPRVELDLTRFGFLPLDREPGEEG